MTREYTTGFKTSGFWLRITLSWLLVSGHWSFICAQTPDPVPIATKNPFTAKIERSGDVAKISIESARPLSDAADLLEHKYGWQINYEDPSFRDLNDLVDATALVSRQPFPTKKSIIPKGGTLDAEARLVNGKPDPEELLNSLVETHNRKGNSGIFVLQKRGNAFYLIPTAVKTRTGQLMNAPSGLDVPITVPMEEANLLDMVAALVKQLQGSGTKLGLGMVPMNFFMQTQVHLSSEKRSGKARDVLQNILDATGEKMAWRTGCDNERCSLHIHLVTVKKFEPLLGAEVSRQVN